MITTSNVLRYWYVWMIAVVLASAAATGFRHGMSIEIYGQSVHLRVWQFIAGCAVFLLVVGGTHVWLDHRRPHMVVRWIKNIQLALSVAFCIFTFTYLQILDNKRMADPRSYFGVEGVRYYEDFSWLAVVFLAAFFASQALFSFALVRGLLRGRTV